MFVCDRFQLDKTMNHWHKSWSFSLEKLKRTLLLQSTMIKALRQMSSLSCIWQAVLECICLPLLEQVSPFKMMMVSESLLYGHTHIVMPESIMSTNCVLQYSNSSRVLQNFYNMCLQEIKFWGLQFWRNFHSQAFFLPRAFARMSATGTSLPRYYVSH